MRQAAALVADEDESGAEQLVRQPGPRHEIAHQDEQRHHAQGVGETGVVDHLRGAGSRWPPAAQQAQSDIAHRAHGEGQRHAQQRQRENGREAQQRFGHPPPTAWPLSALGDTACAACTAAVNAHNTAIASTKGHTGNFSCAVVSP